MGLGLGYPRWFRLRDLGARDFPIYIHTHSLHPPADATLVVFKPYAQASRLIDFECPDDLCCHPASPLGEGDQDSLHPLDIPDIDERQGHEPQAGIQKGSS